MEARFLYCELSLAQRDIAESVNIGQATVSDYLRRFQQCQLVWPVSLSEEELEAKLFPPSPAHPANLRHPLPDFAIVDHELRRNKHVTLQLLWEEYRENNSSGHYSYSRFCHHFEQWQSV
jgi:transposase